MVCTPVEACARSARGAAAGHYRSAMEIVRAQLIAERLHADDREEDGAPLLNHIRRVVRLVDADAQAVAWLHEALGVEWSPSTSC